MVVPRVRSPGKKQERCSNDRLGVFRSISVT